MRPRSDNDDNNLGYICEISPDKFNWFDEDGQPFDDEEWEEEKKGGEGGNGAAVFFAVFFALACAASAIGNLVLYRRGARSLGGSRAQTGTLPLASAVTVSSSDYARQS